MLELQADVTASESVTKINPPPFQLFSFPIPDAGLSIPDIFTLGTTLSYSVGFTSSFQGTASVDFGLSAGLPNSAQFYGDISNPDSSSVTGFDQGIFTPIFNVSELSAAVTVGAYSQPKLSFGISILKTYNVDVDISIKLPEVNVTLTAEYSTCPPLSLIV